MFIKRDWLKLNYLSALIPVFIILYLVFHTDLDLQIYASILASYFIFVGLKDFVVYFTKSKNFWTFSQAILPIGFSIILLFFSIKDVTSSSPSYVGMWAIMLGIAYIVIGWQLYDLKISKAKQTLLTGVVLIVFAMLVLVPTNITSPVFAYLVGLFFLVDGLESMIQKNYNQKGTT